MKMKVIQNHKKERKLNNQNKIAISNRDKK